MATSQPGVLPLRLIWRTQLPDYPLSLAWSPDGSALLTVPATGDLQVLAAENGQPLRHYPAHPGGNLTAAWNPSAPTIASGGQDGTIRLHPLHSSSPSSSLAPAKGWIETLQWSPNGLFLAAAQGKTIHLLHPDLAPVRTWSPHPGTVADLAWAPDSQRLVAAAYRGPVIWNTESDLPERTLEWPGSSLKVAWSPSGTTIATGDQTPTVHIWDLPSNQNLVMRGYETKVNALAWNHSGHFLATSGSSSAAVWDCSGPGPEGSSPILLHAHLEPITCLTYQHRSNLLATGAADAIAYIWWPERHPAPLLAFPLDAPVAALAWHPGDSALAIASASGQLNLCRLPTEPELESPP